MKKNKKKTLVIALLLFALVGIAGYGVYSYYYTIGTVNTPTATSDTDENVINITGSFNPRIADNNASSSSSSSDQFLGQGGSINLNCPEKVGANETFTCTASATVRNSGSTPIRVEYEDFYPNVSSDNANVSIESSSISWSNTSSSYTTISSGSSETIYIEVEVKTGNSTSVASDQPELVTEPIASGSLNAYASFRLEAEQVNN